jgi:hypothetical protein
MPPQISNSLRRTVLLSTLLLPLLATAPSEIACRIIRLRMTASAAQSKNSTASAEVRSRVPFVGCSSDGQTGPIAAPAGKDKYLRTATETAARLAYYAAAQQKFGILGPRSWHCFGTYGSSGSTLYVSPEPLDSKTVLSPKWTGFTGPAIQLSLLDGQTSGRFDIARVIARVFPASRSFVDGVIDERIEPASSFVFGPYSTDQLVYLDKEKQLVEFETPAQTEGLGTDSRLQKNALPIHGLAFLIQAEHGSVEGLTLLDVRLPADLNDLTPSILLRLQLETAAAYN